MEGQTIEKFQRVAFDQEKTEDLFESDKKNQPTDIGQLRRVRLKRWRAQLDVDSSEATTREISPAPLIVLVTTLPCLPFQW